MTPTGCLSQGVTLTFFIRSPRDPKCDVARSEENSNHNEVQDFGGTGKGSRYRRKQV